MNHHETVKKVCSEPALLRRPRWVRILKAQVIGGLTGALITIGAIGFDAALAGRPRDRTLDVWDFALGITTVGPTHYLIKFLGMSPNWSPQGWHRCEVLLNTTIGLLLATPVGILLAVSWSERGSSRGPK